MTTKRILIIDASVVIRRYLVKSLGSDPLFEVVGAAPTGSIGLQKLARTPADIIVLDIESPEMPILRAIRERAPQTKVVVFSHLTERGAAVTLEALALGASDYVTKPPSPLNLKDIEALIDEQLIPKLRALVSPSSQGRRKRPSTLELAKLSEDFLPQPIKLLAIGCSTGGPNALAVILSALPAHFPVPIVIVQHMPPLFTQHLAKRLDKQCQLTVQEAWSDVKLEPGQVWIAPGNYHMSLERFGGAVYIKIDQTPPRNSCRPSVDVLFESAAKVYGGQVLAAVLTGMGRDGLEGSRELNAQGSQVYAQDESSSVVWGMPGHVSKAKLASKILPLEAIAAAICERCKVTALARPSKRLKLMFREQSSSELKALEDPQEGAEDKPEDEDGYLRGLR